MMSCVLRNSGLSSIKFLCATLSHMSIGRRIVRAVTLQQIDHAPHGQTGPQGDDERLQGGNGSREELHSASISPGIRPRL